MLKCIIARGNYVLCTKYCLFSTPSLKKIISLVSSQMEYFAADKIALEKER